MRGSIEVDVLKIIESSIEYTGVSVVIIILGVRKLGLKGLRTLPVI